MKKQRYKVTTESGSERMLLFTEIKHADTFGSGMYIGVENFRTGEFNSIDCRYMQKYNFETICENWIKDYYGDHLVTFEKIKE